MQQIERIDALERSASEIGISLTRLCHLADVQHTTVWRWKSGSVSPTLRKFNVVIEKLEAALDAEISRVRGNVAAAERRRVA